MNASFGIGGWFFVSLAAVVGLATGGCPSAITLPGINTPPNANAGPDATATVGDQVTLNAASSSDADGDALSYHWTRTDSPEGSEATLSNAAAMAPTFVPNISGTYVFAVTVSDDSGGTDEDSVTIVVSAGAGDRTQPTDNGGDVVGDGDPPAQDAAILAQSTFDRDHEGWRLRNGNTPQWGALAGRDGGGIEAFRTNFQAPEEFVQNMADAYGGVIQFDLRISQGNWRGTWVCALTGPNGKRITFTPSQNPQQGWQRYRLRLDTSTNWKHDDSQEVVIEQELRDIVSNPVDFEIASRGHWSTAASACSIDNVQIEAPE